MADNNQKILEVVVRALDSKKGQDIQVLKIDNITVMTDYFVICTGGSSTQVKALADEAEYQVTQQLCLEPIHKDLNDGGKWMLLDYAGVMVHVFCAESRDFYKLERLWADGEPIDISEMLKEDE
ncbi:MAG: ribosome silencing factor [Clostridia bacterium]|nr:ribosome silencing factor [Clostridia bacterium]